MNATFYIDESGNTGTDWLNKEQPFFIYGGWLILDNNIKDLNTYLSNFINKEQSTELKSNKVFKRLDGYKVFNAIFDTFINDFKAIPIFIVIDKEYMVAAKIVETFFDCEYNPKINTYLTHPVKLKKALADCIVNSKDILIKFSSLLKNGTIDVQHLRDISIDLYNAFENANHPQVASTLIDLSDENLMKMIKEFETITDGGKMKNRITLTPSTLIEMLKNVEMISNTFKFKVNVVHDRLRGYSEVFDEIENIFFTEEDPFIYSNSDKIWLSNFPHIKSIIEQDSKNIPLIQASDLLCGFISKIFKKMNLMNELNDIEKDKMEQLILLGEVFNKMGLPLWDYKTSYSFEKKIIHSIDPEADDNFTDFNEVIKRDFNNAMI